MIHIHLNIGSHRGSVCEFVIYVSVIHNYTRYSKLTGPCGLRPPANQQAQHTYPYVHTNYQLSNEAQQEPHIPPKTVQTYFTSIPIERSYCKHAFQVQGRASIWEAQGRSWAHPTEIRRPHPSKPLTISFLLNRVVLCVETHQTNPATCLICFAPQYG